MESQSYIDYSGGIADSYLTSADNCYYKADNFLLSEDGKPYVRPGFAPYTDRVPTSPNNLAITAITIGPAPYTQPLVITGQRAFTVFNAAWWEVPSIIGDNTTYNPLLTPAIPGRTDGTIPAVFNWRRQTFIAPNQPGVFATRIMCNSLFSSPYYQSVTLGVPKYPFVLTATSANPGTTYTYLYAVTMSWTFTDYLGIQFIEESAPIFFVGQSAQPISNTNSMALSSFYQYQNSGNAAYAMNDFKINVYRTINNGTAFYRFEQLSNSTLSPTIPTTSFETTPDANLQNLNPLYTNTGALAYDALPAGISYGCQVNDTFWWADTHTLYQSVNGVPGGCPGSFSSPVDQQINGLSSYLSFPLLFCTSSIYRIEGQFDDFGSNGYSFRELDPTAGCLSNTGIVKIPGGVVWPGNGGFFFSDASGVKGISKQLTTRYRKWQQAGNVVGTYDSDKNIVYWTGFNGDGGGGATQNDIVIALHLNFGISERSVFTTMSSKNNILPVALAYDSDPTVSSTFRSKLIVGESRGYLMMMDEKAWSDALISSDYIPALWQQSAIQYDFISRGHDQGGDATKKWGVLISAEFKSESTLAVQLSTRRDDGGSWGNSAEFRSEGPILFGITDVPFQSTDKHDFMSTPLTEGRRFLTANALRSTRRQVRIRNSYTIVQNSDNYGTATAARASRQVVLNVGTNFWDRYIVGYDISFDADNYTQKYRVISRDSDTQITVVDPYGTMPTSSICKWQVWGYRKNERMVLLSYTLHYENAGMTQGGATARVNANA